MTGVRFVVGLVFVLSFLSCGTAEQSKVSEQQQTSEQPEISNPPPKQSEKTEVSQQDEIDVTAEVDQKIVHEVDLTGDGDRDQLILHITGKNFMHPFTLSVEGRSKGKRIFKREKSDESLEELFGSDAMVGFWRECKDYVDCKYRFYFEAVTGSLLGGFATCDLSCDPESYAYIGSRGMPTRRYLREIHGLSEERIDEIIDRMIEFIRSGHARVISIFDDPIGGGGLPLIYVKEVQDLVPIYAP